MDFQNSVEIQTMKIVLIYAHANSNSSLRNGTLFLDICLNNIESIHIVHNQVTQSESKKSKRIFR